MEDYRHQAAKANPLEGAWKLVRWEISYSDERPVSLPFGADAGGLLVYSADGWMNACIAAGGRRALSSASARSAPAQERLEAFDSFFQYGGPYRIEGPPGKQRVVHSVKHALNPGFVGTEQVREMHFSAAGELTLSAQDLVPGSSVRRHHRLTWQREQAWPTEAGKQT